MLVYPLIAKTIKDIDQFRYHMYNDISINRLQYNHDSSAILRILSCAVDTSCEILEDLKYKARFDMSCLDFTTIDRFNGFLLNNIPELSLTIKDTMFSIGNLTGYSSYTDKSYTMEYIKNDKDFTRHSMPIDCFIGDLAFSDGYETMLLTPYTKLETDIQVLNSRITIRPFKGFRSGSMDDSKSATIRVYGLSLTGEAIEEDIVITSAIDYVSTNYFSLVTGVMGLGSSAVLTIVLSPYLNGEFEEWDDKIVDRETFESYATIITIDQDNKKLVFNILNEGLTFPSQLEAYRLVDLDIPNPVWGTDVNEAPILLEPGELIWSSYVDKNNKLIYIVTDASKLYCFPLIIPTSYTNTLDDLKTDYQSIKVEYLNDTINREYTFFMFPSSRTNDIESLSIFIDREEYMGEEGKYSNMLLDLVRSNIETNRVVIPYDVLFATKNNTIVEFRTSGEQLSVTSLYLNNELLKPLYVKSLSDLKVFTTVPPLDTILPAITSNNIGYKQFISGDMLINDQCQLIKLSGIGNILINGHRIENIFNTFTYSEQDGIIVTSDTITHMSGATNVI